MLHNPTPDSTPVDNSADEATSALYVSIVEEAAAARDETIRVIEEITRVGTLVGVDPVRLRQAAGIV